MRFDWVKFCRQNNVPYVTAGPNTAAGNISIRCPFCGEGDPSQHMGLSTDPRRPSWGCFRNANHRGRHPARLVAELLHVPLEAAYEYTDAAPAALADEFEAAVERLKGLPDEEPDTPKHIRMPPEFRVLGENPGNEYERRFIRYLERRGFGADACEAALHANLRYSLVGEYAWRVIFPVKRPDGTLAGWAGRDIRDTAKLRYKNAPGMGKNILLFCETTKPYESLVVVEGPMDMLKIDFYGKPLGFRAVATLGVSLTQGQLLAINRAQAEAKYILFDSDAVSQGLGLAEEINAGWLRLPPGIKDPGDMNRDAVRRLLASVK